MVSREDRKAVIDLIWDSTDTCEDVSELILEYCEYSQEEVSFPQAELVMRFNKHGFTGRMLNLPMDSLYYRLGEPLEIKEVDNSVGGPGTFIRFDPIQINGVQDRKVIMLSVFVVTSPISKVTTEFIIIFKQVDHYRLSVELPQGDLDLEEEAPLPQARLVNRESTTGWIYNLDGSSVFPFSSIQAKDLMTNTLFACTIGQSNVPSAPQVMFGYRDQFSFEVVPKPMIF